VSIVKGGVQFHAAASIGSADSSGDLRKSVFNLRRISVATSGACFVCTAYPGLPAEANSYRASGAGFLKGMGTPGAVDSALIAIASTDLALIRVNQRQMLLIGRRDHGERAAFGQPRQPPG
jgi:hypothetical protein